MIEGFQTDGRGRVDGRVVRGERTRRAILQRAAEIASMDGLEGVSLGRLASELHLSKAGVVGHYGSKEELQLATVEAATRTFADAVVTPAFETPPGLGRVWALCDCWISYARRRVFPGGCFFLSVSTEFDCRPGRVRELIADARRRWLAVYRQAIDEAQQQSEIDRTVDAVQLAYELDALAMAANLDAQLLDDIGAYDRAAHGMLARLRAVATNPSALPPIGHVTESPS